jgi:hypothetical protein
MTTSEEADWPINLFRRTSQEWQRLQAFSADKKPITIRATPREGSIVVKQVRLRFTTSASEKKSVLVRRNKRILVSSQDKPLVFVLEFMNEQDCIDFSDRFVMLNPRPVPGPPASLDRSTELLHSSAGSRKEVLCYIARLLNDKDFQEYVDALDACLHSNDDYAQMVRALVSKPPPPSLPPTT